MRGIVHLVGLPEHGLPGFRVNPDDRIVRFIRQDPHDPDRMRIGVRKNAGVHLRHPFPGGPDPEFFRLLMPDPDRAFLRIAGRLQQFSVNPVRFQSRHIPPELYPDGLVPGSEITVHLPVPAEQIVPVQRLIIRFDFLNGAIQGDHRVRVPQADIL